MLPELLSLIPPEELIRSVRGDGAYDTEACHAAIAGRKAQAFIPPRENARGGNRCRQKRLHAAKRCVRAND